MRQTTTSRACAALGALLRAAAACAAVLALAAAASAQSSKLGPGPFTNVRVTEKGLLLTVDTARGNAVPLSGAVRISASDGAAWTPFDGKATVRNGGAQALQKGGVGGVPIDEYFPDGQQRRLLVRNGDGAATEIDVARVAGGFLVSRSNRSPGALVKRDGAAVVSGVDATRSSSTTIALPAGRSGYDAVVAAKLPSPGEGVTGQQAFVTARDTTSGETYTSVSSVFGNSEVTFQHFVLPEGTYELTAQHLLSYGNPLVAQTTVTVTAGRGEPIHVTPETRTFEFAIPAPDAPSFESAAITLEGLEPFAPSFGNRLDVTLSIASADGAFLTFARRDVGDASPLVFEIPVRHGDLLATVTLGHVDDSDNGTGYGSVLSFGARPLAPSATLAIPPVVRLTGTILDPAFVLVSGNDPRAGASPYQLVSASSVGTADPAVAGYGLLRGFARGFAVYVAPGAPQSVSATLFVGLGRPTDPEHYWESATGRLLVPAPGASGCDGGCDVDVTVPDVSRYVTISGRVLDARGKPAQFARVTAFSTEIEGVEGASYFAGALTNADGEFRIRVPRGTSYQLTATKTLTGSFG